MAAQPDPERRPGRSASGNPLYCNSILQSSTIVPTRPQPFRGPRLNKGFFMVMAAQALSSIADNALLIAAIGLIADLSGPDWMAPMMKWWFALAYVVLAAFVGAFADSFPKGRVMFATNALKTCGCLLMFSY